MIVSVKERLDGEGFVLNGVIHVPNDPENRHFKAIQEWITTGNTPEPALTLDEARQRKAAEIRREGSRRQDEIIDSETFIRIVADQLRILRIAAPTAAQRDRMDKNDALLKQVTDLLEKRSALEEAALNSSAPGSIDPKARWG